MALCIPISKYRQVKKLRDDAVKKIEEVTKEFDELKETTEEYKQKYENLQKSLEEGVPSPKKLTMGGEDEADGGKLVLDEDPYKEEASKREPWSEELKVKDLARMSMVYLHTGVITKNPTSRRGTLTVKPLEITIVNLSKKTMLHLGASFFKSGRFATQTSGYIEAGESHTYSISSKDGRAKTGVKGGLAFIVYDVKDKEPEPEEEEEEEEKHDEENGEKKDKKKKKEKKEKKKKEKKSKKDKKKKKGEVIEEPQENKEAEEEENKEDNDAEEKEEASTKAESETGDAPDNVEADRASIQEEVHLDEDEEELPEGNGDFFICAFENPLAGALKAKCNKTESNDIKPLVKQMKNHKEISQEYFGQYTDSKRHIVFVWKDEETEW